MTVAEAVQEYEDTMKKLDEARAEAKAQLKERLKALQTELHEELKVVRAILQKAR